MVVCDLTIQCFDEQIDLIHELTFCRGFDLIWRQFVLLKQSHDHRMPRNAKDIGRNR